MDTILTQGEVLNCKEIIPLVQKKNLKKIKSSEMEFYIIVNERFESLEITNDRGTFPSTRGLQKPDEAKTLNYTVVRPMTSFPKETEHQSDLSFLLLAIPSNNSGKRNQNIYMYIDIKSNIFAIKLAHQSALRVNCSPVSGSWFLDPDLPNYF